MAEPGVIEAYLQRLRLGLQGLPDAEESVTEAEDHLLEAVAHLTRMGLDPRDAEAEALRHFGSAPLVTHAHVVDQRKGIAVATTFTRRAGLAGALLAPLTAAAALLERSDLSQGPAALSSAPAWLAGSAVLAFAIAFAGLAQRHRGALGGWGRAARYVAILALPLSMPFGWGAAAALVGWLALSATLLAVGMWSVGVLPRAPLALLAAVPALTVVFLGVGTLAEKDMGHGAAASVTALAIAAMIASISWLGLLMWREPAVDAPGRTQGPLTAG